MGEHCGLDTEKGEGEKDYGGTTAIVVGTMGEQHFSFLDPHSPTQPWFKKTLKFIQVEEAEGASAFLSGVCHGSSPCH